MGRSRRGSVPARERRIVPDPVRRAAFAALGVAAVLARAATDPRRHRRLPASAEEPGLFLFEPFGLGDAISLQPLVRALCEAGRRVTVGTRPEWFPVFPPHPLLTLAPCVPPWADRDERGKYRSLGARLRTFLPELRRHAGGLVGIDPRGDIRAVLALYAAGCVRVETLTRYFAANDCAVLPGAAHRRAVDRGVPRWRLNGVFAPDLPLRPPSLAHLAPEEAPRGRERPVALIPMTPWVGKRWTPEGWRAVAKGLRARSLEPVALCGPGEEDAVRALFADDSLAVRPCGDVRAWVRELAGCRAAIAVNTGPMHIASACGLPVVLLEGSSRLPLWEPPCGRFAVVEHQDEVDCAPCHQVGDCRRCGCRCMRTIGADEVLAATLNLLP